MPTSIIIKIIIALMLGAAVGFERESYENKIDRTPTSGRGSLGVRSYMLITLLGVLTGIIYPSHQTLSILFVIAFTLIAVCYYLLGTWIHRDNGPTTELAMLLVFLFSVLLGLGALPYQLIIALTVVLIFILSLKTEIRSIVSRVRNHELEAFISFALIALVILPFLPNASITLKMIPGLSTFIEMAGPTLKQIVSVELINPFNLWRIVVIITGIDIAGYILEKTVGQKSSWLLTSIAGGFISSTSTTQSLAIQSKTSKNVNGLVAAAVLANVSSFIQHTLLIVSINSVLFVKSIPYISALFIGGLIPFIFLYTKSGKKVKQKELQTTKKKFESEQIFALKPAIQFALLFTFIKFTSKVSLVLFGKDAILFTSAIAALTGMDAVTLTLGDIAGKQIGYTGALYGLIIANAVNLTAKTLYGATSGAKAFAIRFGIAGGIIVICTLLSLIFIK